MEEGIDWIRTWGRPETKQPPFHLCYLDFRLNFLKAFKIMLTNFLEVDLNLVANSRRKSLPTFSNSC